MIDSGPLERKSASARPWTEQLWIYDLRTNQHFTLRSRPLTRTHLDDFVACYKPGRRHEREENERFRAFSSEELIKRDKVNLDIVWLRDRSLEDASDLPAPDEIIGDIVEDLQAALEQLNAIIEDLNGNGNGNGKRKTSASHS
jgi:type I restriction enzyme M protein